jgi:hypothetical protein
MKSYITKHHRCSKQQYNALRGYYLSCSKNGFVQQEWHLFCHILISTIVIKDKHEDEDQPKHGFYPVPSREIEKHIGRGTFWKDLRNAGLIEVQGYDKDRQLCRYFKVNSTALDIYFNNHPGDMRSVEQVNLITGQSSKKRNKSILRDSNNNPAPELIVNAIKSINFCLFNNTEVQAHLNQLKDFMDSAALEYQRSDTLSNKKILNKATSRYRVDRHCADTIQIDAVTVEDFRHSYIPAYRVARTGRIYEIGGGLLSCTREMKMAGFQNIDEIYNYDLKSSQAYGLKQQLEAINVETTWLTEYLNNPNAKKEYATLLGISVDCWKRCLYSIFFGANIQRAVKKGAIYDCFLHETADPNKALTLYIKLLDTIQPLKRSILKWHKWLRTEYLTKASYQARGEKYITNSTGKKLSVTQVEKEAKSKKDRSLVTRRIASFVLQGSEAAFIYHLMILGEAYGYQVLSNQHDGLITIGKVSQEAIDIASTNSGFKYPFLDIKSFL